MQSVVLLANVLSSQKLGLDFNVWLSDIVFGALVWSDLKFGVLLSLPNACRNCDAALASYPRLGHLRYRETNYPHWLLYASRLAWH